MSLTKDLLSYGYTLTKQAVDNLGRKWAYKASPSVSGGAVNYFDRRSDLEKWISDVVQVRSWTNEVDIIWPEGSKG